jgi:hypothetical protein
MLKEAVMDTPKWLLVVGHYPIFSAGEQGDVSELQDNLLPLLQTYNVDAYFCGHDHISEHLVFNGIHFFVAGAGSMISQLQTTTAASLLWSGPGYSAFATVHVDEHKLSVGFVDVNNTQRYSFSLTQYPETNQTETTEPSLFPTRFPTQIRLTKLPSLAPTNEALLTTNAITTNATFDYNPVAVAAGSATVLAITALVVYFCFQFKRTAVPAKLKDNKLETVETPSPYSFEKWKRGVTSTTTISVNSTPRHVHGSPTLLPFVDHGLMLGVENLLVQGELSLITDSDCVNVEDISDDLEGAEYGFGAEGDGDFVEEFEGVDVKKSRSAGHEYERLNFAI